MATIAELRINERSNGYLQSYNDALKVMVQYLAENPQAKPILSELVDRMSIQKDIRELSGWAHSIEVTRDLQQP
jgi:hypothetical protein